MDGETDNPLQIEIIEDDDLDQQYDVDDELAAQPTEEEQHQKPDRGNETEVELMQEPKVETQEPNLVEPEAQEVPKDDTPKLIPGVCRSQRVRTQTKQSYVPSMSGTKYETIMAQLFRFVEGSPFPHQLIQAYRRNQIRA